MVPFNSFAEYSPEPNLETKKNDVVRFAINEDRPLTCSSLPTVITPARPYRGFADAMFPSAASNVSR